MPGRLTVGRVLYLLADRQKYEPVFDGHGKLIVN